MEILKWFRYKEQEEDITSSLENAACENDPIATLLVKRYRLRPLSFVLLGILGVAVIDGLTLLLYELIPSLSSRSLFYYLSSWYRLVMYWVVLPASLAFYPWFIRINGRIFRSLYINLIASNAKQNVRELLLAEQNSIKSYISYKRWPRIALFAVIASAIFWVTTGLRGDWIVDRNLNQYDLRLYMFVLLPFLTLAGYMLFTSLAKVIGLVQGLFMVFNRNRLFGNENEVIRLRPLHPDKYGGLGVLNYYVVRLILFISLIGMFIILNLYSSIFFYHPSITQSLVNDTGLWIGTSAYIIVAPTLFFLTLYPAKRELHDIKTSYLHKISSQISEELQSKLIKISSKDHIPSDMSTERLRSLCGIYELIQKNPTWAFRFPTLINVAISYISPSLAFLVPLLLKDWF